MALGLRLAGFEVLRSDGDDPVLILDDVFAELDGRRRRRLTERVAACTQVLITAAVAEDVPARAQWQAAHGHEGEGGRCLTIRCLARLLTTTDATVDDCTAMTRRRPPRRPH